MKKMTRILCLIAVFAMCLSLCGCGMLDDLRAKRATMTADGNIKLYDGTEYKLLPECKELSPTFYQYAEVYVVEENVPLLLTTTEYSLYFDKSDDGKLLLAYDGGQETYYCRSDVYDSVLERIQNGFTPQLYSYVYYDAETGRAMDYTLTQEQWNTIEQIMTTQKPLEIRESLLDNYDHCAGLYVSSADGLFSKNTIALYIYKGKCYVLDHENDLQYTVPAELTADIEKILEKQIESDMAWDEW